MIEAFWRSLRHQWLYLHSLDSFTQLEQLIDFYVDQHNTQTAHHAFDGIFSRSESDRLYCQGGIADTPGWECVIECQIPEGLCKSDN